MIAVFAAWVVYPLPWTMNNEGPPKAAGLFASAPAQAGKAYPPMVEADVSTTNHHAKTGIFTAYTARKAETDKHPYVTADGSDLRDTSQCVLANNALDFGTKVRIEGLGTCEVKDRMAEHKGANHFDIYMGNSVKKAKEFGRQKLRYQIVAKPPKD